MISLNHPHLSQGALRAGNVLGSFNHVTCYKIQIENTMCIKKPREFLVFVMKNVLTILYSRRSQCDDFTCTRLLLPSMWYL